ncbi:MAG: HlyD family efflux transporter periplasmic adaptor subunit [Pseudomonadales bacterium]
MAQPNLLDFVIHLETRARAAENLAELAFSIANDTHAALHFHQALVLNDKHQVICISGLIKISEDSPYTVWLKRAWPWVASMLSEHGGWFAPTQSQLAAAPGDIANGWAEWWTTGVLAMPLRSRDGKILGWIAYLLNAPPTEASIHLIDRLGPTWAYCWEMLVGKPRKGLKTRWKALSRLQKYATVAVLCAFFLLPVRQTALAPAEIVAEDAMVMTATLDGVVKTIHVRPNQSVKAGDLLFSLDDTTLRNRESVAQKSLAVADAELQSATQISFDDSRSKTELTTLAGSVQEKRAELAAVQMQLARTNIRAPYDGIAVFTDPDDWQGRPVVTGERIMLLANPSKPALLIHLPVADAIAIDVGAPVKFFLTVRPLSPLSGKVSETSYEASVGTDGIANYQLRATLNERDARIGLRGTAKLYGDWVVLGYYLVRRPLAKMREWSGL